MTPPQRAVSERGAGGHGTRRRPAGAHPVRVHDRLSTSSFPPSPSACRPVSRRSSSVAAHRPGALSRLARFWTEIFAVSFAMGVVSGIVLSYQFGTNWSRFSEFAGNVIGPLIGYEVLTAFFLEATFLGILLFGWNRVPPLAAYALRRRSSRSARRSSAFWILVGQLLDADAGRPRDPRRHRLPGRLARDRLQPELSLPSRPHGDGGLSRPPPSSCSPSARAICLPADIARRPHHAAHGGRHDRHRRAAAARHRRSARPEHARAPAGEGRRDGGALGRRRSRAISSCSPGPTRRPRRTASKSRSRSSAA